MGFVKRTVLAIGVCLSMLHSGAGAGEIVLSVQGPGSQGIRTFTEAQIRSLPALTVTTLDPWDNQRRVYKGCTILSLLEKLGCSTQVRLIEVVGNNDYKAKFTIDEIIKYRPILSYEMDGKDYSAYREDNKGPLAIAVEMEAVEKADRMRVKSQIVWWIQKINLQ